MPSHALNSQFVHIPVHQGPWEQKQFSRTKKEKKRSLSWEFNTNYYICYHTFCINYSCVSARITTPSCEMSRFDEAKQYRYHLIYKVSPSPLIDSKKNFRITAPTWFVCWVAIESRLSRCLK